ncbi:type I 3-dehydroquinate dehydratase [Amphibacillus cookii]|uniref:type I 3-dehydroquinate dehydratase n=1 Tax=Amphibacillus cookii TaxID=767787 RepID=UPI00195AE95B|nr:type I 3-dehydroquinate dehydratase [Amphibacillus cookii]MBM7540141.1 3-dehydroquinate dehydratase-1 [Amphibacillus cookii]
MMLNVRNVQIGVGQPKVCLPITGHTIEEITDQAMELHHHQPDLVEWRADFYQDNQIGRPLKIIRDHLKNIPLIFTFRTQQEGGEREVSSDTYYALNKQAIESGVVDFIDIELLFVESIRDNLILLAKQNQVHTMISNHDFNKTLAKEEMINRLKEAELIGGSIAKLAVMPQDTDDLLNLLSITNQMKQVSKIPIVTMAMGNLGLISRLAGEVFGSALTFATFDKPSAPGQIDYNQVKYVLDLIHNYR